MLQKINADTNAINWFDIPVTDLERAKKFYETIFDIEMETAGKEGEEMAFFPRKPHTIMGLSGILSGSLLKKKDFSPGKDGPIIYLNASPSLQTVLDKVEKAGGKIVMDRTKIPAGFVASCIDTEGNRIGLHAEV
ncbi:MAG TPA: VOC family protein [Chitinophagaceae bacterium]|nr:VOC family protein [Chitinophagaceae bacterium]